jgi:unsaturated chondroitin disaccharide hydrolase
MSVYDYLALAFYLGFMLSMGPVFMRFSRTASDYFRGGGGMLWWVVGSSVLMTSFSAWSFTGGAAKAYETGTFFLLLFFCNIVSLVFTYFVTAERFRQMRIITKIEGVRKRFGDANEQVFTWLPLPFNVIMGGLALYTISVFMNSVFGINITLLIFVLAATVTLITLCGGAWAAAASDFVQLLLILGITLVMAALTLGHPQVGGLSGLLEKLPREHLDWTLFERPWILLLFGVTLLFNQLVQNNSMMFGAAKYVYVKNGADARRATLVAIAGFLFLAPIWMIPAVAATILHPNLAAEYPSLNNPHEASYVAMATTLLPRGLLGVLVSAIFAASVATMTSQLSIGSGIFVRNFYIRVIRPDASEPRQILVGRWFTVVYGLLWIGVALGFKHLKSFSLFDLMLLAAASVQIPTTVPLFLGMFVKRTPPWAGWSTMVVGFTCSVLLRLLVFTEPFLNRVFSPATPFTPRELVDLNIAVTTAVLLIVCVTWFFGTMLFYRREDRAYVAQVERFFKEMKTPIDPAVEHGPAYARDSIQYRVVGTQALVYGGFICLLLLIPNSVTARLCILFCAMLLAGAGVVARLIGRRLDVREARQAQPCPDSESGEANGSLNRESVLDVAPGGVPGMKRGAMISQPKDSSELREPTACRLPEVEPALALCIEKTRRNIRRLADEPKSGAWAVDGNYFACPEGFYDISNWTSSFFTGMALLAWRQTGEDFFLQQVQRLAPHYRLKVHEHDRDTMHDLGFLYSLYSVALFKLTGEPAHRQTALRAAKVLAGRFETRGQYLRAWGRMEEQETDYAGLAIIDSMMNLPLLFWAAEQSGDSRYRDLATQHADTTLRHFVRADGSVFHAYRFDPRTGQALGPANYCGYAVDSHWARGAAWAIYGFALSYGYTRDPRYLETSLILARTFVAKLDAAAIPVWDFKLPPVMTPLRDSSAAAIAVCGMQELLRHQPAEAGLRAAARRMLARLRGPEYLDGDVSCPGLLRQAQVGDGAGRGRNAYASWGDYFLMEALTNELAPGQRFW